MEINHGLIKGNLRVVGEAILNKAIVTNATINENFNVLGTTTLYHTNPAKYNTFNLGTDDQRWKNLYTVNADIGGELSVGKIATDLTPNTTSSWSLGENGKRWQNLYLNGNADINGTLTVKNTATLYNIYPATNNQYNLGQDKIRWKNLYLSANADINGTLTVKNTTTLYDVYPAATDQYSLGQNGKKWQNLYLSANADIGGELSVGKIATDLIPNTTDSRDLGANKIRWRNAYISGTLFLKDGNTDTVLKSSTSQPALQIGNNTSTHLIVDNDEIMVKSNNTTAGTLYLNYEGGAVEIGQNKANCQTNLSVGGTLTVSGTSNIGATIDPLRVAVLTTENTMQYKSFSDLVKAGATSETHLNYTTSDGNKLIRLSNLRYWDGRYSSTASALKYCNQGAFGSMATENKNNYLSLANGGTISGAITFNNAVLKMSNLSRSTSAMSYYILVIDETDTTHQIKTKKITISSSTPSSGNDGDIWIMPLG